jgi:hypothetical protein
LLQKHMPFSNKVKGVRSHLRKICHPVSADQESLVLFAEADQTAS